MRQLPPSVLRERCGSLRSPHPARTIAFSLSKTLLSVVSLVDEFLRKAVDGLILGVTNGRVSIVRDLVPNSSLSTPTTLLNGGAKLF